MFKKILFIMLFLLIVTLAQAVEITLQWDSNTEPDLAGYFVYYKRDIVDDTYSGPPYDGTGALKGNSPIKIYLNGSKPIDSTDDELNNNNNPEMTITLPNLPDDQRYYFSVTAFDNEIPSLESDYSNEVNVVGKSDQVLRIKRKGPQSIINISK